MNSECKNCKICNSPSSRVIERLTGYQQGTFFDVYYCKECDTSFVSDVSPQTNVSNSIYDLIYKHSNRVPGYQRYYEYSEAVLTQKDPLNYLAQMEDMYWAINECISQRKITEKAKIVEVGCGFGYLTYALRKSNFNVIGIDISEKAISKANEKFGNFYKCANIYDMAGSNSEKYDVVILTEVIEHIENPNSFMYALKRMLNTNGIIILTTPNKSAYSKNSFWDSELPPIHLFWLSERSIEFIAHKLDMHCTFINFSKFNKWHLDPIKLKNYSQTDRLPVFDENGNFIGKSQYSHNKRHRVKSVLNYVTFGKLRYLKNYYLINAKSEKKNMDQRHTLCAVLSLNDLTK